MKVCLVCILLFLVAVCAGQQVLLENWRVQVSDKVSASPQEISVTGFDDSSWYQASVPANGTVMAVLLQNNVYQNILVGVELLKVPSEQFNRTWWYRTEFPITINNKDNSFATITFKGINYKANVWFNGIQIGDVSTIVGTFRYFTFDISKLASSSEDNALAVEIYKPINKEEDDKNVTGTDLSITFVDWAAPPPDSNMGLWQEVVLTTSGPVTVDYPLVSTVLNSPNEAELTILAELTNYATTTVSGILTATISELGSCSQNINLPGNSVEQIFFVDSFCPMLKVKNPKLWWPAQMGTPYMYTLTLSFTSSSGETYNKTSPFGIRQITSYLNKDNHRGYQINGKNLLIRGAGWAPDLFQRTTPERQEIEMKYVQHLNLNTIRLEGKFENDNLFNLADQYGILVLPGICCCDAWQNWDNWDSEHYYIAQESIRSQVKRLRIHPSILAFMYSSDMLPPMDVEKMYLSVFASEYWPNPLLASADKFVSNITGPTGVKMSGPYSWVSPNYWLLDTHTVGGAFGFLTEGGPGESPLEWDSFIQTFSSEDYWPINSVWDYHCGAWYGNFHNLDYFTSPLNIRYGETTSASDYIAKSQLAAYEGQRAMFEGYSRNKYTATGVIQWMLNNAFSEMIWHLYDIYLMQGGGYYGSKKACEPLHVMYSYDDQSIWIVNSVYEEVVDNLEIVSTIYDINSKVLYNSSNIVSGVAADTSISVFTLPSLSTLSTTYFLKLSLYQSNKGIVSDNFYWLSTKQDVPDFANSTWFNTPCTQYADFTLLQQLPTVPVSHSFTTMTIGADMVMTVTLVNPRDTIAFFIRLRVIHEKSGTNIVPIFWDDNYITLMPNETRQVNVTFSLNDLGSDNPFLLVEA